MHPIELIELMIASGILLVFLLISFVFKGKWRMVIQRLAIVYVISFISFYVIRPYWIDLQLEKKVGFLQLQLEQQYPEETWEIWTVPHREDGYESMNPYSIGVIFENEPDVQYKYFVRNKDNIIQTGYSIQNEHQRDLLHIERE
ncbi:hypothetical protein [Calidifontibacillus oryziterrae]|uniref:hypothetical protein n=1 Tax=Calidifontibacillus oryziterrae TaxID=1191699 RepID=UPI0003110EE9|nr:hypothetical protein [Calidifontibacillus oryziterrae]